MYNFLFDKKTLMLLLAGLGLSGALLFFAGLLVGVEVGLPSATSNAVAVLPPRERPEPAAKPAPALASAECPCEPGVQTAALQSEPCPQPEPAEAPVEKTAPPPVPVEEPEPVVVASVASPEPELASEMESEAELVAEAEPAEAQPAEMEPAAAFSVQVGAFRNPENMEKTLEELRSRGYEPYVVELPGSRTRVLHTVRIGRYADRTEALRAASDFRRRERMAAVVLRVGS